MFAYNAARTMSKPITLPLALRVLLCALLGAALGVLFGKTPYLFGLRNEDLGAVGLLVIKLLRALAVPLVFFAILDAFVQTKIEPRRGVTLVLICLVNGAVAMTIALTIINGFHPGESWRGQLAAIKQQVHPDTLKSAKMDDPDAPDATLALIPNLEYYVPKSLLRPFIYNNVISVVLLALLAGAAMRRVREEQEKQTETTDEIAAVERFVAGTYQVLIRMLEYIIRLVPLAVLGVVAKVVGSAGLEVFRFLWVFLAVCLAGLAIHSLLYYPLVAWLVGRKPVREFLGRGADAIFTGLTTNSSLATVPVTLRCLEKMNVTPASARLAACVGTNLNNDGITLYEAVAALFIAQALGMTLGLPQQMTVVFASLMAGAGVAGIPEAGFVVLPLVLGAAGLPAEIVVGVLPLLLPVDWIIARARSGVNVMSDMLVAILLDRFGGRHEDAPADLKGAI